MLSLAMRLSLLSAGVRGTAVLAGGDFDVRRVVQDSRLVKPGDLFVAVRGLRANGHDFAAAAAASGAAVALQRPMPLPPGTPQIRLTDTRWGLGELAAVLHGRPARRLKVIGVTGSAGKTTTTHLTAHVLGSAGLPAGYLSTVANSAGTARDNESGQTTMDSPDVQAWLALMVEQGMAAAVIEVSSHALDQGRVAGCEFDVAAFTNVGCDHLEYHSGPEAYLRAKARLIELCASAADKGVPKTAVLNHDDGSYEPLAAIPVAGRLTYGIDREADLRALDLAPANGGVCFRMVIPAASADVRLSLPGRFNVSNALCAAACGLTLGLPLERVAAGLSSFPGLRGRLERIDLGQPFSVYVDFAHSAVALAGVLEELRFRTTGRLLAVFGASARSGGHDPAGMGRAAARNADFFVITTDDPLAADPAKLARQVEAGAQGRDRGRDYEVVLDRRSAIRLALERARPGDVVLLAGKGHERTMMLADGPVPWDERGEAEQALHELGLAAAQPQ
ncbi:MAG TPA: UDP-N-acetylmuramoyl-L-alanyl-D-glutamate--2,6-diaminopimelate ligase [Candidatus Dormibacteraeota bacterium]|nr:UDP-N-acetylmuramoyl-L-alanyl-D-glutamate--2,6-diaminopimelate ligase [Candidatus Dormibacteraeota bacterium]